MLVFSIDSIIMIIGGKVMRNRIIALCLCVFISMSICLFSMAEELYEENYRSQYGPVIRVWGDDQRLRYEYVINPADGLS